MGKIINNPSVSVIIPTFNAGREIIELIESIKTQTISVEKILVIDSGSTDGTVEILKKISGIELIEILNEEFDHGKTRDMALRMCESDIIVFMTQDVVLHDNVIEALIKPLVIYDEVVASTGRQLPKEDATSFEREIRLFNYPPVSRIWSKDDIERLGIKAFFFSDVCAAYKKEVYLELGGFDYPILTNEDMFMAAKIINAGYKLAYVAEAMVFHSHNLTLQQQYKRNFIQGYEMEKHKDIIGFISKENEGIKLVKVVGKKLIIQKQYYMFLVFLVDCFARLLGSLDGKRKCLYEHK